MTRSRNAEGKKWKCRGANVRQSHDLARPLRDGSTLGSDWFICHLPHPSYHDACPSLPLLRRDCRFHFSGVHAARHPRTRRGIEIGGCSPFPDTRNRRGPAGRRNSETDGVVPETLDRTTHRLGGPRPTGLGRRRLSWRLHHARMGKQHEQCLPRDESGQSGRDRSRLLGAIRRSERRCQAEEFPDLLHPNAVGYLKWSAALRPIFETLALLPAWPDDFEP